MKIVITNDDGFGEPGLIALAEAVQPMGEVFLVAPQKPQSGIGHSVTMKAPIKVEFIQPRQYVVYGTPADCTRLALKQFVSDAEWVVAGVNPGANLGTDVYQSGTVAAAREAAILGVKAIAVSQYISAGWVIDWKAAIHHLNKSLPSIMNRGLAYGQFWNINLPSPIDASGQLDYKICPLDKHPHNYCFRKDGGNYRYEGVIHDRPRAADSDVDVCFGGRISVTRLEI